MSSLATLMRIIDESSATESRPGDYWAYIEESPDWVGLYRAEGDHWVLALPLEDYLTLRELHSRTVVP